MHSYIRCLQIININKTDLTLIRPVHICEPWLNNLSIWLGLLGLGRVIKQTYSYKL